MPRPPLPTAPTNVLYLRVPQALRERLIREADQQGRSMQDLAIEALEQWLQWLDTLDRQSKDILPPHRAPE